MEHPPYGIRPKATTKAAGLLSRKSAIIFGQGTIPEPSTPHIGKGVALVAQTATLVYIYARITQIAVKHVARSKQVYIG
jgi:hypothetical protein